MALKAIIVKTDFEAFHYWEDAPDEVGFLRNAHRHVFKVNVQIEVKESDRELEFFMVKAELDKYIEDKFKGKTFSLSCEMIAEDIVRFLRSKYKFNKAYSAEVYEDGENGGLFMTAPYERLEGEEQEVYEK